LNVSLLTVLALPSNQHPHLSSVVPAHHVIKVILPVAKDVDKEACGYMDETMRLFEMYKEEYSHEIEAKVEIRIPHRTSFPLTSHRIKLWT